jgi:biotin carboxyl carrier protein
VHEVRAPVDGTVTEVDVDEGQMIAEGDPLVVVRSADATLVIETEVPGVVRELYVELASELTAGDVIALIDES